MSEMILDSHLLSAEQLEAAWMSWLEHSESAHTASLAPAQLREIWALQAASVPPLSSVRALRCLPYPGLEGSCFHHDPAPHPRLVGSAQLTSRCLGKSLEPLSYPLPPLDDELLVFSHI